MGVTRAKSFAVAHLEVICRPLLLCCTSSTKVWEDLKQDYGIIVEIQRADDHSKDHILKMHLYDGIL